MPNGLRLMVDTEERHRQLPARLERARPATSSRSPSRATARRRWTSCTREVVAAGFEGEKEPWDAFWGQRYAQLRDPDGVPGRPVRGALKPRRGGGRARDGPAPRDPPAAERRGADRRGGVRRGGVPALLGRALAERPRARTARRGARACAGCRCSSSAAASGCPRWPPRLRGAEVLATDWAEDAIELLRRNAERNGVFLRVARVRWSEPEPLLRPRPGISSSAPTCSTRRATPSSSQSSSRASAARSCSPSRGGRTRRSSSSGSGRRISETGSTGSASS